MPTKPKTHTHHFEIIETSSTSVKRHNGKKNRTRNFVRTQCIGCTTVNDYISYEKSMDGLVKDVLSR